VPLLQQQFACRARISGRYNGRILRVNLSNGNIASEAITEQFCRKYIGGAVLLLISFGKNSNQASMR